MQSLQSFPAIFLLLQALHLHEIAAIDNSEKEEERPTPQMWMGTTPFCQTNSNLCGAFGFEKLEESSAGCWIGSRQRCTPRPPATVVDTPANELRVFSYNAYEMLYFDGQTGQRERTCRIPHRLLAEVPEVDVVMLQEVFMGGCWPTTEGINIRDLLAHNGFRYFTRNAGSAKDGRRSERAFVDSGVFIASRHPIVTSDDLVYQSTCQSCFDQFAKKGAAYAKIVKSDGGRNISYHLFNTHLESNSNAAQKRQVKELRQFIDKQGIPSEEAVILGGDLNMAMYTNPNYVNNAMKTLGMTIPPVSGSLRKTVSGYMKEGPAPSTHWIDYVLYSNRHRIPTESSMQSFRFLSEQAFYVCASGGVQVAYVWPNTMFCKDNTIRTSELSDHLPVLGTYKF